MPLPTNHVDFTEVITAGIINAIAAQVNANTTAIAAVGANPPVSHGASVLNPTTPTGPISAIVWRVPPEFDGATVLRVVAQRTGGTGATVNASHGGVALLPTDLSLTTTNWTTAPALQNATLTAGQDLTVTVVSVAGTPSQIAIQVDIQK
jgi:hypothetical protein